MELRASGEAAEPPDYGTTRPRTEKGDK